MIWTIIKNAAADIWDEMLYLMMFNLVWVVSLLLIIPWPLATFGLVFTIYDIGEAKGIGLGTFWKYIRQTWRQAYLWGVINLAVGAIFWINWNFYTRLQAEWAGFAQMVVLAISLFWVILQLLALPFYPRLEQPGFKLALRNAGVTLGRYPLVGIFLLIVFLLVLAVASFFSIVYFLGAFSIIAVLANRVVAAVLAKEKQREQEREA